MQKILITGATGFIGKHLYQKLKELKYDVTGIALRGGIIDRDKIIRLDITNKKAVEKIFNGKTFDLIFHLATFIPKVPENYNLKKCLLVNGIGTYNLLLASEKNKVEKFVYSSSGAVYNRKNTLLPAEEEYSAPENIYGISKLVGENICEIFRKNSGLKTISLRYASVYGTGQEPYCVLPLFVKRALKNKDIKIFGSGERTQDFIYVDDVVEANIKSALSRAEGIFNVGSGQEVSMVELAETILNVFSESKSKIKKKIVTNEDKSRFVLDINKAKKKLKFSPQYSLEQGLQEYKKIIYDNRNNL